MDVRFDDVALDLAQDDPRPPPQPSRFLAFVAAPVVVDFALRGQWTKYHAPCERVTGYGTDQLEQRYGSDLIRIDKSRPG